MKQERTRICKAIIVISNVRANTFRLDLNLKDWIRNVETFLSGPFPKASKSKVRDYKRIYHTNEKKEKNKLRVRI